MAPSGKGTNAQGEAEAEADSRVLEAEVNAAKVLGLYAEEHTSNSTKNRTEWSKQ